MLIAVSHLVALGVLITTPAAAPSAKRAQAQQFISLEVLFKPKWVCSHLPCGGDRPPFRSDQIAASALNVDAGRIVIPAGQMDRRHVLRIRVGPPGALSDIREFQSPKDMVVWRSGRRTFGALTISKGLIHQAGYTPKPLPDARMVQFAEAMEERVTGETLRIGPLRRSSIPRVDGYEMERCWIEMSADQQQQFKRLRGELGPTPAGKTLGAEMIAIRSLGRRYGPDGQYLCQFKVTALGKLRWFYLAAD